MSTETVGGFLKRQREAKAMSVAEVARVTRIPVVSLEAMEQDHFDSLPGEVFVRGFLRSYANAVGVLPDEALAKYSASRRVAFVVPLPMQSAIQSSAGAPARRFGVAMAFVVLLLLFTLALSFVLKPRGRELPVELSSSDAPSSEVVPLRG